MNLPVREVGVVTALSLLSICSAHGLAKVARRLDRRSTRSAHEALMNEPAVPRSPRSTRDLIRDWDEVERCSEFRSVRQTAEGWVLNVYETL